MSRQKGKRAAAADSDEEVMAKTVKKQPLKVSPMAQDMAHQICARHIQATNIISENKAAGKKVPSRSEALEKAGGPMNFKSLHKQVHVALVERRKAAASLLGSLDKAIAAHAGPKKKKATAKSAEDEAIAQARKAMKEPAAKKRKISAPAEWAEDAYGGF
jgi:hypothetical protein